MELEEQQPSRVEHDPALDSAPENRQWSSRSNVAKVLATYYSFVLLGANDSSYGVCDTSAYSG